MIDDVTKYRRYTGITVFLETVYYRRAFCNTAHPYVQWWRERWRHTEPRLRNIIASLIVSHIKRIYRDKCCIKWKWTDATNAREYNTVTNRFGTNFCHLTPSPLHWRRWYHSSTEVVEIVVFVKETNNDVVNYRFIFGAEFVYSEADFEFFLPRRGDTLHRWGEIWLLHAKFHPIGATVRV